MAHKMKTHPISYYKNKLMLLDIDLARVAKKHGTPTYVYSKSRILQKVSEFQSAFSSQVHIHYAMKANFNKDILRLLSKQGLGADVVSGGEIKRAIECGFSPSKIIFSGVGKSEEEICIGLQHGISIFNVESPGELSRIGALSRRLKKTAGVSFRLNPNVDAKTHPYITTGFKENKFGMDKSFLPELLKILKQFPINLKLLGIDFHIGSQLTDSSPFEEATEKVLPVFSDLKRMGYPLKYFDIGGGIGISYKGEASIDLKFYARRIEKLLKPLNCEIVAEPGRFLVGDSGILLTQVEYIKKTPYKTFIIVNTGMNHLLRPALYEAYHEILPLKKTTQKPILADVVGPICESSDWLAKNRRIVEPKSGDLLAICDVGAYGYVMASDYNLHRKPSEVVI